MQSDIEHTKAGWYFYMKDRSCKIGPYSDPKECQSDLERYLKTGRIGDDPVEKKIKTVQL